MEQRASFAHRQDELQAVSNQALRRVIDETTSSSPTRGLRARHRHFRKISLARCISWRVPDRESLVELMDKELSRGVLETRFGFTQPIEERVQDMLAGIKADVAVHIYGDDLDRIIAVGRKMLNVISEIPGSVDERMLPRLGLPSLDIEIDREEVARYGINVSQVLDTIETIGGHAVGQLVQGQARYFLQVRFTGRARKGPAASGSKIESIVISSHLAGRSRKIDSIQSISAALSAGMFSGSARNHNSRAQARILRHSPLCLRERD